MVDDWPKTGDEVWAYSYKYAKAVKTTFENFDTNGAIVGNFDINGRCAGFSWVEGIYPTHDACIAAGIVRLLNQANDRAAVLKEVGGE